MTPALPTLFPPTPGRLVLQVKPFPSSLSRPLEQIVEKEKGERQREKGNRGEPNLLSALPSDSDYKFI